MILYTAEEVAEFIDSCIDQDASRGTALAPEEIVAAIEEHREKVAADGGEFGRKEPTRQIVCLAFTRSSMPARLVGVRRSVEEALISLGLGDDQRAAWLRGDVDLRASYGVRMFNAISGQEFTTHGWSVVDDDGIDYDLNDSSLDAMMRAIHEELIKIIPSYWPMGTSPTTEEKSISSIGRVLVAPTDAPRPETIGDVIDVKTGKPKPPWRSL